MILLETVNGMTDITFNLKDLGIVVAGVIATLTAFLTLSFKAVSNKEAIDLKLINFKENHDKEILAAKNGRYAVKKEIFESIIKLETVVMNRIDNTQRDMKEYGSKTDAEFKEINEKLNKILGLLDQNKN